MPMETIIKVEEASKVYRTDRIETMALDNVSVEVAPGESMAVMGPSGCGKSTLLNLMGLLDAPSRGEIWLDEKPVSRCRDTELSAMRNTTIGFVFQSFHLVPDLTILDNVEIPLLYRRMSARERRRKATDALGRVGLGSRLHHFPAQLSGGQQQRAAIARAIVGDPRVVLADEPTGNLDSQMGDEVMDILMELNRQGTTVVMVTHDPRLAERTGRTLRLFDGRRVE